MIVIKNRMRDLRRACRKCLYLCRGRTGTYMEECVVDIKS